MLIVIDGVIKLIDIDKEQEYIRSFLLTNNQFWTYFLLSLDYYEIEKNSTLYFKAIKVKAFLLSFNFIYNSIFYV